MFEWIEPEPIKVFYCYARADEKVRARLAQHLEPLRRSNKIVPWYDREISPGMEYKQEIISHIDTSDIILALVSPDFISSSYCQDMEMRRALHRHVVGTTRIIPIILKDVEWQSTPLGELQALPTNAKPLSNWHPMDKGFRDVFLGIQKVVDEMIHRDMLDNESEGKAICECAYAFYDNKFYREAIPLFKKSLQFRVNDEICILLCLVDSLVKCERHEEASLICDYAISLYQANRSTLLAMKDKFEAGNQIDVYGIFYDTKLALPKTMDSPSERGKIIEAFETLKNDSAKLFKEHWERA